MQLKKFLNYFYFLVHSFFIATCSALYYISLNHITYTLITFVFCFHANCLCLCQRSTCLRILLYVYFRKYSTCRNQKSHQCLILYVYGIGVLSIKLKFIIVTEIHKNFKNGSLFLKLCMTWYYLVKFQN